MRRRVCNVLGDAGWNQAGSIRLEGGLATRMSGWMRANRQPCGRWKCQEARGAGDCSHFPCIFCHSAV